MNKYVFGIFLGVVTACTNYNEEELYPDPACEVGTVTYAQTIHPILENSCTGCHSSGFGSAGVILDSYIEVQKQALNGRLLGSVSHAPSFHPMPHGGSKLPDCTIAKIKAWVDAGAPNN